MKNLKKYYPYIVIGLISLTLNLLFYFSGSYDFIESKFLDFKFKIRGPIYQTEEKTRDVVIVEIDDQAFELIDESYPFPRGRVYSKVIKNLTKAGAKVIVFDIMFDAPDHTTKIIKNHIGADCLACSYTDEDEQFVQAINYASINGTEIILASKIAKDINRIPPDYIVRPTEKIMDINPKIGLVNQGMNEFDYSNRKYSIIGKVSSQPKKYYLSLAMQSILSYKNISDIVIKQDFKQNIINISGFDIIPFNNEASILVNYYGPVSSIFDTFNTYSLSEVIDTKDYNLNSLQEDDNWMDKYINEESPLYQFFGHNKNPFKDKIVLIGSSLDEDNDFVISPYYFYKGVEKNMPGVELHANVIQQILDSNYIDVPLIYLKPSIDTISIQLLLMIALIIISIFLANSSSIFKSSFYIIVLVIVWFSFSIGSFLNNQFWFLTIIFNYFSENINPIFYDVPTLIPAIYPVCSIIITYGLNLSYNLLKEQKNKKFLKETFGKYVSPKIIEIMYTNKKMPELGGESGIRTAFFSDIQSFSTVSEQLSSKKLVDWLNEYLTCQTEIILKYQGTLDKYEGDAILAFFGAPLFFKKHAKAGIDASIECQKNLTKLNEKWASEGKKWPSIIHSTKMRIGINSGDMVTGNMGSEYHMNYTMIGDVVNTAARLESSAKQYGIFLHSTEDTLEIAGKNNYLWRYIDRIQFVGKTSPIQTVEILDFNIDNDKYIKLIKTFHEALKLYYQQNWDLCIKKFKQSLKLETKNKQSDINPSRIFIDRAKEFKINPPPKKWNGANILTRK